VAKVIAGNDGARQLDIGRVRLNRRKGGFDVPDRHAKEIAQAIGGTVVGTGFAGARTRSFWCEPCQFRSVLRRCGRCGANCTEE
jgi:hypothetical protein